MNFELVAIRGTKEESRMISSVAIQEQLARIPKRLRFYEDAAKVVQRQMVPNFKKSFERAVRTARR